MQSGETKKTHDIIMVLVLGILHAFNSYQVCVAINEAPRHRFDVASFAYVVLAIPFAILSLLAMLQVMEQLNMQQKRYYKKAALVILLIISCIIPLLFAFIIDSVTGTGFMFTIIVVAAAIFGLVRIVKKDDEEKAVSPPKGSLKLLVFALLVWLFKVTVSDSLFVHLPNLPINFHLGLLVSFIAIALLLEYTLPKYPKLIYILWVWIAVAAYILISNVTRDEWWMNGMHIDQHFDKIEKYVLRNGRKVDIEIHTYLNGDTALEHNYNPVAPGIVYLKTWDREGKLEYYQYDSIIDSKRIPIQYHNYYYETGELRSTDKHFFIQPVVTGRRVYYFRSGEKNAEVIYNNNKQVKSYRYDKHSLQVIDSISAYPPAEWFATNDNIDTLTAKK